MKVEIPTSHLRFGFARVDITPPVGIYHRMWGAARHDRAEGIHRSLYGDVLVFAPVEGDGIVVRANLDLVGLATEQHGALVAALGRAAGTDTDRVVVTYSHTHAAGWFTPNRIPLPGGEMIPAYLEELEEKLVGTCKEAMAGMREVTITYARGRCTMARNRDCWDGEMEGYVCGFNPEVEADDTVMVGRVSDGEGQVVATLVNYACHPTTLAWDNTLISPDFIGSMREEVEQATGAPCTYAQGACGDLGPRRGFVGDTAVADANGRELAYAALGALTSMGTPGSDFHYQGPVVSGATLGAWGEAPFSEERWRGVRRFGGGFYSVDLPYKEGVDRETFARDLEEWTKREKEADVRGDAAEAQDCRARAERARRWLARLDDLPGGKTYALRFSVHLMGDAVWCTCGAEPYNLIQTELRRRFPDLTIVFSPLSGNMQVAYLLPKDRYGKGLYQEEPSSLAPGCLEILTEAVAQRIGEVVETT